ncbi:MAG TPA: hypothetical protein VGZ22_25065, partial [Isosphaeraceae bacterium]|nr:hypothetical protein [Isosphaeraceae bacterium]
MTDSEDVRYPISHEVLEAEPGTVEELIDSEVSEPESDLEWSSLEADAASEVTDSEDVPYPISHEVLEAESGSVEDLIDSEVSEPESDLDWSSLEFSGDAENAEAVDAENPEALAALLSALKGGSQEDGDRVSAEDSQQAHEDEHVAAFDVTADVSDFVLESGAGELPADEASVTITDGAVGTEDVEAVAAVDVEAAAVIDADDSMVAEGLTEGISEAQSENELTCEESDSSESDVDDELDWSVLETHTEQAETIEAA